MTALLIETGDTGGQRFIAGDSAGNTVAHLSRAQVKGVAADQLPGLGVVERPGRYNRRILAADQAFLAVIDAGAVEGQGAVCTDRTALILQDAHGGQCQGTGTRQAATSAIKTACIDRQSPFTADQTSDVAQGVVEANIQTLLSHKVATAVVQALPDNRRCAFAEQLAFGLVNDLCHTQGQIGAGEDFAAITVDQL